MDCSNKVYDVPRSNKDIAPVVAENDRAKILRDFQMQKHQQVIEKLSGIVVVANKSVVMDGSIPNDSIISKKEQDKQHIYI